MAETPRSLVIIGGGITGLAAARAAHLQAAQDGRPVTITLVEGSSRLGGKLQTVVIDGVALELGADSFLAAKPAAARLATDLGLDLVAPGPLAATTYLQLHGRLRPLPAGLAMGIPTGPGPLIGTVTNGILSPLGALRAGLEPFIPRGKPSDHEPTVGEVIEHRLGHQVASRLVAPLISGIFGASSDEVSMVSAFPAFAEQRSLVLAMAKRPRSTGPTFLTIPKGLHSLVDALEADLRKAGVTILTDSPVASIALETSSKDYIVTFSQGDELRTDAVLMSTSAATSSSLLRGVAPEASAALAPMKTSSSAVVLLRYAQGSIGRTLDGAGYLVAPQESQTVAACTWLPAKWPHHPWKDPWVRATVTQPAALLRTDEELALLVEGEISATLEAHAGPQETRLHRWSEALPIYGPGHRGRVQEAKEALPSGLALAGAAYDGFGIPDCITSGEAAGRAFVTGSPHPSDLGI